MILLIIGVAVILLFTFHLFIGPPFLPTLGDKTGEAIEMLNLKAGQLLIELGSGDGRVLKAAAKKGIRSVGYEINPLLALYSKITTYRYRKLVTIKLTNFWKESLKKADGIYIFGLDRYMMKLNNKIIQECHRPLVVVSFAFRFPGRKPTEEKGGLFLYKFNPK